MTKLEAIEHAKQIWGFEPHMVQIRPDGGADLDYGYADADPYGYHRLDVNGHVACHVNCQDREKGR